MAGLKPRPNKARVLGGDPGAKAPPTKHGEVVCHAAIPSVAKATGVAGVVMAGRKPRPNKA
jgi:hypothetical protein